MEIREAAKSAAKDLGYPDLKPEQLDVVETFVKGRDVFAVLLTDFGKSLCFACLPIVFNKLLGSVGEERSIVVVVTPLTAIIKDQVSVLHYYGLDFNIAYQMADTVHSSLFRQQSFLQENSCLHMSQDKVKMKK